MEKSGRDMPLKSFPVRPRRVEKEGFSLPPERRLEAAGAKTRLWDGRAYKGGREGRQARRERPPVFGHGGRVRLQAAAGLSVALAQKDRGQISSPVNHAHDIDRKGSYPVKNNRWVDNQ